MSLIGGGHNFDFNEKIFTRQFLWKKFTEIHQIFYIIGTYIKQLLDEVEHDIMNYQNLVPSASADNTDVRF